MIRVIPTKQTISPALRGSLCAVIGGIFWGFSGTCAQYLFSNFHVPPLWLSCTRLFFTAIILTVLALLRHPAACRDIWKDHRHVARLAAYGIFGLMACQSAYIMGISYSNAATTTVLQTLSLVFILLITCARVRRFPTKIETAALLLALFGTFLLATGGKPGQLVISPAGLLWGLATAWAVVLYSMLPSKLLERYDRETVTALGMAFAAVTLNLLCRSWRYDVQLPLRGWLAVAAIVVLGSVVSFSLIMQSIVDIGPSKSSMLASSEPLSAKVFSVLWLGTSFSGTDLIGFAAIISTIFLLTRPDKNTAS